MRIEHLGPGKIQFPSEDLASTQRSYNGTIQASFSISEMDTPGSGGLNQFSNETLELQVQELAKTYDIDPRAFIRRIDLHVLPPFCLLYFISFLNRSSFGLYILDAIPGDLDVNIYRLSIAYAAFFAPYIFFQFFSTIILKYVKPHFWISLTVLFYGAVGVGCAYVKTIQIFTLCQFLHGLFQSGTETAIYYILSHYYTSREAQWRFTLIFSMNAIGGLISALINLGVRRGQLWSEALDRDWRWLMLIEGAITMGCSLILFVTFPDFPEGARFFDDNETMFLIKKLEIYGGKSGYNLKIKVSEVLSALADPLIYCPSIMAFGMGYVCFGITLLNPMVFANLGWVGDQSSMRTVYLWIAAFVFSMLYGGLSAKLNIRWPFFVFTLFGIVAGAIMVFHDYFNKYHNEVKYVAAVLFILFSYSGLLLAMYWGIMNLCGHLRKSVGTALLICSSSVGSLISYWCFYNLPTFKLGFILGMAFIVWAVLVSLFYTWWLHRLNRLKRTEKYKAEWNNKSERDKIILGDKNPNFDYMY